MAHEFNPPRLTRSWISVSPSIIIRDIIALIGLSSISGDPVPGYPVTRERSTAEGEGGCTPTSTGFLNRPISDFFFVYDCPGMGRSTL